MVKAVFAGSFDPPTNGHLNVIQRASKLFDSLDVVVAVNSNKKCLFSSEERVEMMKEITRDFSGVSVHSCRTLIVDYAKKVGAKVLIRGVRGEADFAYEFELALLNHHLNPEVETLFIPTDQKFLLLKSSTIKELALFGGDFSPMVPPCVKRALDKMLEKH